MSNLLKYRIVELLQARGISAMELASLCKVHVQSIYKWSNIKQYEEHSIPADKLRIISNKFGVSMEEMYTIDENSDQQAFENDSMMTLRSSFFLGDHSFIPKPKQKNKKNNPE